MAYSYKLSMGNWKTVFLSSGLMGGWYYTEEKECYYGNYIINSEKTEYALPTISLDYRF